MSGSDSEPSAPLIPRDQRPTVSFPQQGSIDWVALGKSSVSFSVEALSRISKAGVEALTLYAARTIFRQLKL